MEKDCGAWINILAHKVKKRLDATLQDIGITGVQSRVIYYILNHYEDGPVFQKDIENVFGLSRSTATGILQLLEKNGIILRESVDNDARLKSLVPTEKGRQCAAAIHQCISDFEHDLQNGVSAQELEAIQGTLHKLIENAKAIRGKN